MTIAHTTNEWDQALRAVRELLRFIGEDPDREGLRDTPLRVLKAWQEHWGAGYSAEPPNMRLFSDMTYKDMVLQRGITFFSHCEHHLCPFMGTMDIAYIPHKGVVGLSKLARAVEHFSRRLQCQERLTDQVADFLAETISPDVGVIAKASHMCMTTRGVMQHNSTTTTAALRGKFLESGVTVRPEFYALLRD